MARGWWCYTRPALVPSEVTIASNYSWGPTLGSCGCSKPANNICAVFATVAATQPILTLRLQQYLNAAAVANFNDQPIGGTKYVITKGS